MTQDDLPLLELFSQLRECGLLLGIGEYQLVLRAWQAGYGTTDRAALKRLCQTVWVKSPEELEIFEAKFNQLVKQLPMRPAALDELAPLPYQGFKPKLAALATFLGSTVIIAICLVNLRKDFNSGFGRLPLQLQEQSNHIYSSANQLLLAPGSPEPEPPPSQEVPPTLVVQPVPTPWWKQDWLGGWATLWLLSGATLGWLQIRSMPRRLPEEAATSVPLALNQRLQDEVQIAHLSQTISADDYLPVTRRQMKQSWRSLRRMARQGPPTDLDVEATVQQVARQGVLLAPVLCARRINRAKVLLLIDHDGSMVPFHGLSQRLVETTMQGGRLTEAGVYYFRNCPVNKLFRDPSFQFADPLERVLQAVRSDYAGILLVSDGGAACGRWNPRRLDLTDQFLTKAFRQVRYIAWLNPMPQYRWTGTTAEGIAKQVPMFEFNRGGLEQAIGVLQGQRRHHP